MITFDELIGQDYKIYQSTKDDALVDSVKYKENYDVTSFFVENNYETNNIALFSLYNENLKFIDIPIQESYADIINNIKTKNVKKFQILLNGKTLNNYVPCRIIKCSSMYTEIKIRLFFDKEEIPKNFSISYNVYIINDLEIRKEIIMSNFIDDRLKYSNGVIINT